MQRHPFSFSCHIYLGLYNFIYQNAIRPSITATPVKLPCLDSVLASDPEDGAAVADAEVAPAFETEELAAEELLVAEAAEVLLAEDALLDAAVAEETLVREAVVALDADDTLEADVALEAEEAEEAKEADVALEAEEADVANVVTAVEAAVVALVEETTAVVVAAAVLALELGVMETTVFLESITNGGVKLFLLGSESEMISRV